MFRIFAFLLLIIGIFIIGGYSYTDVSDTWSNIPKILIGNFNLSGPNWEKNAIQPIGFDTVTGKTIFKLQLTPSTKWQFKYGVKIDSDTKIEIDFPTQSKNREITIVDTGAGQMWIDCNWNDTPSAPTNLQTIPGNQSILVLWQTPGNNNLDVIYGGYFNIYYCTNPALAPELWTQLNTEPIRDTTQFLVNDLQNGMVYYFCVKSIDAYGSTSSFSDSITGSPAIPLPVWFAADIGGHVDTGVYLKGDFNNWSDTANQMTLMSSGYYGCSIVLQPGATYQYKVYWDGDYEQDQKVMFSYFDATGNLLSVQITGDAAGGWGDSDPNKPLLKKTNGDTWTIELSAANGASYKYLLNGVYESGDNRTVIGVPANRTITVPNYTDTYYIDWSSYPDAPTNLNATVLDSQTIRLSWEMPADNVDKKDIYGYRIYRSETSAIAGFIAQSITRSLTYIDTNLASGKTYYYRVCSIDSGVNKLEGYYSNYISVTPAAPQPVVFRFDVGTVSGTQPIIGIKNYDAGGDLGWQLLTKEGASTIWSCTTYYQPGTVLSYKYAIQTATDTKYEYSSSNSRDYTLYYPYNGTDTRIQIHIATTGFNNDWKDYDYGLESDGYWRVTAPNLSPGPHQYKLIRNNTDWLNDPTNSYGLSKDGNSIIGIDAYPDEHWLRKAVISSAEKYIINDNWEDTPYIPIGVSASILSSNSIIIKWTKDIITEDLSSIKIYRSATPQEPTSWQLLATVSAVNENYTDTGLTMGIRYYYKIANADAEGNISEYSHIVSAKPLAPVDITFILDAGKTSVNYNYICIGDTFNNWSTSEDKLTHIGQGKWKITKQFYPGTVLEYKFNINGTTWEKDKKMTIYYYDATGNIKSVNIAGTFNNWNTEITPLTKISANTWAVEIGVSNGAEYKFIIEGQWETGGNRVITGASPNRLYTIPENSDTILCNWNDNPEKPTLTLAADIGVIYVKWNDVDSDVLNTNYILYKSVAETSGFVRINYGNQYFNYADTDVSKGVTYYYKIVAFDSTDSALQSDSSITKSLQPGYLSTGKFVLYGGNNPDVGEFEIAGEFNNWNMTANKLQYDSNGVWIVSISNIVINKEYQYKYIFNKIQWENISGNRIISVKEINYDNWQNNPAIPSLSLTAESGAINLNIKTNDVDIKYYNIYRDGSYYKTIYSSASNVTFDDTDVLPKTKYGYSVDAVDWGGLASSKSDVKYETSGYNIEITFVVDLRKAIYNGASIINGVQITGEPMPLSNNPIKNRMTKIKENIYSIKLIFTNTQSIYYNYVINAGTIKQENEKFEYTFRYYAPTAHSVKVTGTFTEWSFNNAYKMTNTGDGNWIYTTKFEAGVTHEYKYIIDGQWESVGNRILYMRRNIMSANPVMLNDIFGEWASGITKPQPPKGLISISFDDRIELDWEDNIEYSVNSYPIYKGNAINNIQLYNVSNTSNYTDIIATSDTNTYYYYVTVIDKNGNSSDSSELISGKLATSNKVIINKKNEIIFETDRDNIINKNISAYKIMDKSELDYFAPYDNTISNYKIAINNANNKIKNYSNVHFLNNDSIDSYIFYAGLFDEQGKEIHNFDSAVTISMNVDSTYIQNYGNLLKMYTLDEWAQSWNPVSEATIISSDSNSVKVTRKQNSIYIILRTDTGLTDLSQFVVYPNPMYYYSSPSREITFLNLPADLEYIKIFTINAELVSEIKNLKKIGNNINAKWDCRNDHGNLVASGVYIYYIKTANSSKTGKISVIK